MCNELYQKLQKWLEKLNDNEFQEIIASTLKPGEQTRLTQPATRNSFLNDMRQWGRLEEVEGKLKNHQIFGSREPAPEKKSTPPHPENIPFTNRTFEIESILRPHTPPYRILDAPAGYGKTILMKELHLRFVEDKWLSIYAEVHEKTTISHFLSNLLRQLRKKELPEEDDEYLDEEDLILDLLDEIQRQKFGEDWYKGFALLIDLQGRPCLPILQKLLKEVIPEIAKQLKSLKFFSFGNQFRFVISGRYIASFVEEPNIPVIFDSLQIEPFRYAVVREAVKGFLTELLDEPVSKIAAHLMYLTGGHPGCIAHILKRYGNKLSALDRFFPKFSQGIWQKIVCDVAERVRSDIDKNQRETLDKLSIFRYTDYQVLTQLFHLKEDEAYDLADELTYTYLLTWRGRLLYDDITRRLLSIRLRQLTPDKFSSHCQNAQQICLTRLQDRATQRPEKWVLEYLFQVLQDKHREIQTEEGRNAVRENFLNNHLPLALQNLVEFRPNRRGEKRALQEALHDDWEFRFTVNYFLRHEQYDDEAFKELQQRIEEGIHT